MNEYGSSDDVTKSFDRLHQNVSPEIMTCGLLT